MVLAAADGRLHVSLGEEKIRQQRRTTTRVTAKDMITETEEAEDQ